MLGDSSGMLFGGDSGWGSDDFRELWPSSDSQPKKPVPEWWSASVRGDHQAAPAAAQRGALLLPNLPEEIVALTLGFLGLQDLCGGAFAVCRGLTQAVVRAGAAGPGVGVGSALDPNPPPPGGAGGGASWGLPGGAWPSWIVDQLFGPRKSPVSGDTVPSRSRPPGAAGPGRCLKDRCQALVAAAAAPLRGPPDVALVLGGRRREERERKRLGRRGREPPTPPR